MKENPTFSGFKCRLFHSRSATYWQRRNFIGDLQEVDLRAVPPPPFLYFLDCLECKSVALLLLVQLPGIAVITFQTSSSKWPKKRKPEKNVALPLFRFSEHTVWRCELDSWASGQQAGTLLLLSDWHLCLAVNHLWLQPHPDQNRHRTRTPEWCVYPRPIRDVSAHLVSNPGLI